VNTVDCLLRVRKDVPDEFSKFEPSDKMFALFQIFIKKTFNMYIENSKDCKYTD
jgi:hypothetical protein